MSENPVISKKTLVELITQDWAALNHLLNSLTDSQWTEIKNADGWAIKDHAAHLSAWERSVIAFLTRTPRHIGLQVTEALYLGADVDAINAAIFQKHRDDPLNQVQAQFEATHAELLRLIEPLTDDDLARPYVHYLPDEPGEGHGPPAIEVIVNNTTDHYREHQLWIEAMLASAV